MSSACSVWHVSNGGRRAVDLHNVGCNLTRWTRGARWISTGKRSEGSWLTFVTSCRSWVGCLVAWVAVLALLVGRKQNLAEPARDAVLADNGTEDVAVMSCEALDLLRGTLSRDVVSFARRLAEGNGLIEVRRLVDTEGSWAAQEAGGCGHFTGVLADLAF